MQRARAFADKNAVPWQQQGAPEFARRIKVSSAEQRAAGWRKRVWPWEGLEDTGEEEELVGKTGMRAARGSEEE